MIGKQNSTASRLKSIRLKTNLNVGDFAEEIGITHSNYSALENGRRVLGKRIARDISTRFGVDIDWLLFGKGEMGTIRIDNSNINTGTNNAITIGGDGAEASVIAELREQLRQANETIKELRKLNANKDKQISQLIDKFPTVQKQK